MRIAAQDIPVDHGHDEMDISEVLIDAQWQDDSDVLNYVGRTAIEPDSGKFSRHELKSPRVLITLVCPDDLIVDNSGAWTVYMACREPPRNLYSSLYN